MTVALVCMPFAPPDRPSIALGLLSATLQASGLDSKTFYFNLDFYSRVDDYLLLAILNGASQPFELVGEFIFHQLVFEDASDAFVERILRKPFAKSVDHVRLERGARAAQATSVDFIDELVGRVRWQEFEVVGFTSVFQQQMASLALAKRLKARFPHLRIVFGGSNCHADMGRGMLESFPFIDAVCTGEGDRDFITLIEEAWTDCPPPRHRELCHARRRYPPLPTAPYPHQAR